MSDWQERITRETAPAIRAEHELRYRIAAPLVVTSAVWADLGCGNGLAAVAALGDSRPPRAILVDVEEEVTDRAASELRVREVNKIVGDLTDSDALKTIGEALTGAGEPRVVTCFEVVEHLSTFVPLLEWSGELARTGDATFVISVPNDAFWSIQNPHHLSAWGEGAFEELRRLLPPERTLMRQLALSGSALVDWEASPVEHEVAVKTGGDDAVATHFIAAYGPRHSELWRGALATQVEMLEQRRWERQRENNLAVMEHLTHVQASRIEELERDVLEQHEQLRANTAEFDDWRAYIHELERELGRPLAGSPDAPPPPDKPVERSS
jgi:hypothetical protein